MPPQHRNYPKPVDRERVTPPHVSLRALRKAMGLRIDDVIKRMQDEHPGEFDSVNPGTISAIENGHRGVSARMLAAMHAAYGLKAGDEITTAYTPRPRKPSTKKAAA